MELPDEYTLLIDTLKEQLDEILQELVEQPVAQALSKIPGILAREDWPEQQKIQAIRSLQLALTAPFLGAAVNAAHGSRMDLGTFLNYCGQAWEEVRNQMMAHVGQEILNRGVGTEPVA
jgi:secreted Zn-dependent insulinase-like peptidase